MLSLAPGVLAWPFAITQCQSALGPRAEKKLYFSYLLSELMSVVLTRLTHESEDAQPKIPKSFRGHPLCQTCLPLRDVFLKRFLVVTMQ